MKFKIVKLTTLYIVASFLKKKYQENNLSKLHHFHLLKAIFKLTVFIEL